jgi:hypothetical protein
MLMFSMRPVEVRGVRRRLPEDVSRTSGVPQIADDFAASPKSAALGQLRTPALQKKSSGISFAKYKQTQPDALL